LTYGAHEGVSLQKLVKEDGGLSAETKDRAVEALQRMHQVGVLHGDLASRNVVRREAGGKVLWQDPEFSALRLHVEQGFDAKARHEVLALEGLLQDVETIAPGIVETTLEAKASISTLRPSP
jgi:tRNA A-37 threonylcarbamoyl transferase component Bud32